MKTLATILVAALAVCALMAPAAQAVSTTVVISQVYGGGGGASGPPPYLNDYVVLHNVSCSSVSVEGWSVQYSSAAGSSWAGTVGGNNVPTLLHGSIPAGGYYLVQENAGATVGVAIPTPDATGLISMSASAGKIALVNNGTALTGTNPLPNANIIDFVGYGSTANAFEGAPTATIAANKSLARNNSGCTDTDNNSTDFTVVSSLTWPIQNSATAIYLCQTCTVPTKGSSWGQIRNLYR